MKRFARAAVAVVAAVVLFVVAVHTPPVRRMVLRYVIADVQRRYAIRIDADRLDYNLAALTVGLSNVRIVALALPSTSAMPPEVRAETPFFSADYASVSLPARALTGVVAFKQIVITDGHLRVVRDTNGRTNLPASSSAPNGEPAALDVARLFAPGMGLDLQDAVSGVALTIPAL